MYNWFNKERNYSMKKFLEFAGLCALGLAIVGFILMMVTPAVAAFSGDKVSYYAATDALFGTENVPALWPGLLAWIFVLVAMVGGIVLFILPLVKINLLGKFSDLASLIICGLLVVAGVFLFFESAALQAVINSNAWSSLVFGFLVDSYAVGAGWIVAAILLICAGAAAGLPAILRLVGKK